jgi:hypothetical protein
MIELVLVMCLIGSKTCIEHRPVFEQPLNLMECVMGGQFAAAQFMQQHPGLNRTYRLASWRCEINRKSEKAV